MNDEHFDMNRDELVRIVDKCTAGIAESTRQRLLDVALATDAVAAGWFFADDGTKCPIRQAGRRTNQRFQAAFDYAMAQRFGLDVSDMQYSPIVVHVSSGGRES